MKTLPNCELVTTRPTGTNMQFTSKEGGGEYTVIGNVNCPRCNEIIEEREWTDPSKKHRKKGSFYAQYKWCQFCGLYEPNEKTKTFI